MAGCKFCGEQFQSRQAVRAHLQWCAAYQDSEPQAEEPQAHAEPLGSEPTGREPQAHKPKAGFDPVHHVRQQVESEELKLRLRQVQDAHKALDAAEEARRRRAQEKTEKEAARRREEDLARRRAELEAEQRRRREEAEAIGQQRRREIIQGVKDTVVGGWWKVGYTIPPDVKARAFEEIETRLAALPVDELPRSELIQIAEGVRDRLYRPTLDAQDEAERREHEVRCREKEQRRAAQEKEWQETLERLVREGKKQKLLERGVQYASDELKAEDLPLSEELEIEGRVREELQAQLTGAEAWPRVRDVVDEILDEELGQ